MEQRRPRLACPREPPAAQCRCGRVRAPPFCAPHHGLRRRSPRRRHVRVDTTRPRPPRCMAATWIQTHLRHPTTWRAAIALQSVSLQSLEMNCDEPWLPRYVVRRYSLRWIPDMRSRIGSYEWIVRASSCRVRSRYDLRDSAAAIVRMVPVVALATWPAIAVQRSIHNTENLTIGSSFPIELARH